MTYEDDDNIIRGYSCNQCREPAVADWFVYSKRKNGCNPESLETIQQRIQKVVRVSQSEYLQNLAGLHVYTKPLVKYGNVNWNQASDRAEPAEVKRNVPSHGNSTKTSITRMRPGSCSAPGKGVDVKHGSYARYLARLKGKSPYRKEDKKSVVPVEGNKVLKYSIAYSNECGCMNK